MYKIISIKCSVKFAIVISMFQIAEFEGKDTAQLVDRYKFLDLYPCTLSELK